MDKFNLILTLLREKEFKFLWQGIFKRFKSEQRAFGLKRDITKPVKPIPTFKKITITPAKPEHHPFFDMDHQNYGIVKREIPVCYVALTEKDVPCFRQWLISPEYNKEIRDFWGDSYPVLKEDEALIENAFTVPKYRGFGIMPAAMDQIAQKAKEFGAKYVITFSPEDNINSIRACHYAGFRPYLMRTEKWFFFRKSVHFDSIPPEMMEHYNTLTGRRK